MRNIIEYKNLIWVDITDPTNDDISYLKSNFRLHSLTLKTIIPSIHYPDLDVFKNYIFMILHYPHLEKNGEIQIRELDIVAGKNYLITSHYQEISPLQYVFNECLKAEAKKRENFEKGIGYLFFTILNLLLKRNLLRIDRVENEIDEIEKEIFLNKEKKMVRSISHLKRKIIAFWRITEPQRSIFFSLKNIGTKFFGREFGHYSSILFRTHRRIENTLKNSKETIESLEETNHILVNVEMNEIIRILTIFSALFLPLTLLASIWGMNTNFLPLQKTNVDFWIVLILMLAILGGMVSFFKAKKWF